MGSRLPAAVDRKSTPASRHVTGSPTGRRRVAGVDLAAVVDDEGIGRREQQERALRPRWIGNEGLRVVFGKGGWPAGRDGAWGYVRRPSHTEHLQVAGRLAGTRRHTDGHRKQVRPPAGASAVRSRIVSTVSFSCDAAVAGHTGIMQAAHAVGRQGTRARVIRIRHCPCYFHECTIYCGATF